MIDPATIDEEDLRSSETAPANLAAVASRNLAAQDLATAKINAVARMNPSPGVGEVGSTSATDTANLNVAAAMDRSDLANRTVGVVPNPSLASAHEDDILTRLNQVEEHKKTVMARLGFIPPAEAGFNSTIVFHDPNPQERKDMLQTLSVLENESQNLRKEHQTVTAFNAKQAYGDLVRQTHIQVANGKAKIFSGLADINQQYPIDSPEHGQAILKLFGSNDTDIAAARVAPGFETLVRPFIDRHDKSVATAARIKEAANQPADQYYSPEALLKDNPGAEYRQDPKTGGYYVALAKESDSAKIPQAAYTDLGRLNAKKASDSIFLAREVDPGRKADMQKKVDATQAAIDAWHETYTPKKTDASAPASSAATAPAATSAAIARTPAKRFVFNPVTKKLEPAKE